jgi:hypothetical protein
MQLLETRKVKIDDILLDKSPNIRETLNADTVARYAELYEEDPAKLPVIGVFVWGEKYLLSYGFHRVAGAKRVGLEELNAAVMEGTLDDAIEAGIKDNAANGLSYTVKGYRRAVLEVKRMHPDWGYDLIAKAVGRGPEFVRNTLCAQEVRDGVFRNTTLPTSHLREIHRADKGDWDALVQLAEDGRWTRDEINTFVKQLQDASTFERRTDLLRRALESAQVSIEDTQPAKPTTPAKEQPDTYVILMEALSNVSSFEAEDVATLVPVLNADNRGALVAALEECRFSIDDLIMAARGSASASGEGEVIDYEPGPLLKTEVPV